MTKEDIKNICKIYDNFRRERDAATIAYNSEDAFWAHILTTYNLSKLSLSSNLNEAAEKYANRGISSNADPYEETMAYQADKNAFKAGAQWMARQGVKIGDTKIYLEDDGDEPPYAQEWLDLESTEFKIPDGAFKDGDEVEVILCKKQ